MDIKLKNNKNIGILLSVLVVLIASIGMIISSPIINKNQKEYGYNIYEDWRFTDNLNEANYNIYYKLKNENNPIENNLSKILLEEQENNNTYFADKEQEEYKKSEKQSFDQLINHNIEILDNSLLNLEYYAIDKENYKTKQRARNNISVLLDNNKSDLEKELQEKYEFYLVLGYDKYGNMSVKKSYGANRYNIISNLNNSDTYRELDMYRMKPIKNMTYIYAISKDLKYDDSILN